MFINFLLFGVCNQNGFCEFYLPCLDPSSPVLPGTLLAIKVLLCVFSQGILLWIVVKWLRQVSLPPDASQRCHRGVMQVSFLFELFVPLWVHPPLTFGPCILWSLWGTILRPVSIQTLMLMLTVWCFPILQLLLISCWLFLIVYQHVSSVTGFILSSTVNFHLTNIRFLMTFSCCSEPWFDFGWLYTLICVAFIFVKHDRVNHLNKTPSN